MPAMPVTNRAWVGLTPSATTDATFKGLAPVLGTIKTGLAIFALFIIVRYCASRVVAWLRRERDPDKLNRQALQPRPLWTMDEKSRDKALNWRPDDGKKLAIDPHWKGVPMGMSMNMGMGTGMGAGDAMPRPVMSRPPPAPPLTPPELSTAVFTFQDRPMPRPRPVDDSFMHQPNPDYMSSTTTAVSPPSSASPTIPRRRSYNKTLPMGVPVPPSTLSEADSAELTFAPSSYPPTGPLLPPAPPVSQPHEMDMQGEIVGVLDGDGAGWTRHTRVYGGGVCLACAASGGDHGGGFYGATVRPEEMR